MQTSSTDPDKELAEGTALLDGKLYPNMDDLPELTVGTVLANLKGLYWKDQPRDPGVSRFNRVYSKVGPVLVAVNPFEDIGCYGNAWAQVFRVQGLAGKIMAAPNVYGPHCYCTVEEAFQNLQQHPRQSIVICGESGSGKTYTNKLMLDYLFKTDQLETGRGSRRVPRSSDRLDVAMVEQASTMTGYTSLTVPVLTLKQPGKRRTVKSTLFASTASYSPRKSVASLALTSATFTRQLAAGNLLLEAFGNAKTSRNDNSSRFGKLSVLTFIGVPLSVCSLAIEHYLLERSRVTSPGQGERNYHILHQLAAVSEEGPEYFDYVSENLDVKLSDGSNFNDDSDHHEVTSQMIEAGFKNDVIDDTLVAIKAVLYLGNVKFQDIPGDQVGSQVLAETAKDLDKCCQHLGIVTKDLERAILETKMCVAGETFEVKVDSAEAKVRKDSVSKLLYSRIFDKIVGTLNSLLAGKKVANSTYAMGLLDIFGFEDMPINLFEQLFINLTNEQMQCMFNQIMIQREADIYLEEGILDVAPTLQNNSDECVSLFMSGKPQGIISALAEALHEPGTTASKDGSQLVRKLYKKCKWNPYLIKVEPGNLSVEIKAKEKKLKMKLPMVWEECFRVKHYAGTILYTVRDFLVKSKDSVDMDIVQVFQASTKASVSEYFNQETKKGSTQTVGEKFRQQLKRLREHLGASEVTFVRCIKPTPTSLPKRFDPELVLEQMHCGGIVAALEVRRAGLPDRMCFSEFVASFFHLVGAKHHQGVDFTGMGAEKYSKIILDSILPQDDPKNPDYVFGRTRVFFKTGILAVLRRVSSFKVWYYVTLFQLSWRSRSGRQQYFDVIRMHERLQEFEAEAQVVEDDRVLTVMKEASEQINPLMDIVDQWRVNSQETMKTESKRAYLDLTVMLGSNVPKAQKSLNKLIAVLQEVHKEFFDLEKIINEMIAEKLKELDGVRMRMEKLLAQVTGKSDKQVELRLRLDGVLANMGQMTEDQIAEYVEEASEICEQNGRKESSIALPPGMVQWFADMEKEVNAVELEWDNVQKSNVASRAMLQEAMPDLVKKMQEADRKHSALAKVLEEVDKQGSGLHSQKFLDTANAIGEATIAYAELKQNFEEATDLETIEAAFLNFTNWAERAESANKIYLEKRKQAAAAQKQNYESVVRKIAHDEILKSAAGQLLSLLADSKVPSSRAANPEEKQALEELQTDMTNVSTVLEKMGFQTGDFKPAPQKLGVTEGPWDPECFFSVGMEPDVVTEKVQVIKRAQYSSLMTAVDALNRGDIDAKQGLCLAFSERQNGWCLLFQSNKYNEARKAVGGTPPTLEERVRLEQRCLQAEATIQVNGPWHPDRFFSLGAKVDELLKMAQVLDKSQVKSVASAVSSLNNGEIEVPAGYCLVFSELLGVWCLVFKEGKYFAACDAIGGSPPMIEDRQLWEKEKAGLTGKVESIQVALGDALKVSLCEGTWHPENCFRLGGEPDSVKGMVHVLKTKQFSSVRAAVDALNRKEHTVPDGYCVVYSERLQGWCLIFEDGKYQAACDAVGGPPPTFAERLEWRAKETKLEKPCSNSDLQSTNTPSISQMNLAEKQSPKYSPDAHETVLKEVIQAHEDIRRLGDLLDVECERSTLLHRAILGQVRPEMLKQEGVNGCREIIDALRKFEAQKKTLEAEENKSEKLMDALIEVKAALELAKESAENTCRIDREFARARSIEAGIYKPVHSFQDAFMNLVCSSEVFGGCADGCAGGGNGCTDGEHPRR